MSITPTTLTTNYINKTNTFQKSEKTINKTQSIRIATWNANGLMQYLAELEIFLNTEKIDVCLISESHFTRTSYARIRGYVSYHALHPAERARGGSTIFVRENIKHHEDLKIEEESMQVITVKVQLDYRKTCKISAIYCPPRYKLKKDDYINLFKKIGGHFIIGGDFNAKNTFWGSRLTTPKGKELFAAAQEIKCDFHSGTKPTYWPTDTNKIPDLIDFFVTKGLSDSYIYLENDESLISDHSPVIMTISETVIERGNAPQLTNSKTNWLLFKQIVEENIELQVPLKSKNEIEDELDIFLDIIQRAAWESTPRIVPRKNKSVIYPIEVRELVQEKRKARKKWQRSRAPQDKTILNRLCNELKALIKEVKNETIGKFLSTLTATKDTDYSLWKAAKGIKRPKMQIPPIKTNDGKWARSAKEKADIFAAHLEETFQPLCRQTACENVCNIARRNDTLDIKPVIMKELRTEIKNLKAAKAPGYDLITGQVIKELPDVGVRKLLHIINATFRKKYVPRQWKVAEVIMIQKPDKPPNDRKSYRPISLLPVTSKLLEKLLLKRLKIIIEQRNLIPQHQFGFREKHSTIEQVHRITDVIENTLENKKVCSGVFLDVAQAFDKVWHRGLLYKLKRDLPKQFYMILKSYIEDRHFRVKYEEEYSELKKISAGVPQGSVLGPILYLLYTRDLPNMNDATIATFADDTAILTVGDNIKDSTAILQTACNKINKWTKMWRIGLNETKSSHINFTNLKICREPVFINGRQIPYANTTKYLGMTLDARLRWKEHVIKKKDELNIRLRKMFWLMGKNSELSVQNKLLLYRQVLKPIWTYGIQLWGCTKQSNIKMIQTFQNKVLRCIVNAPWYIRNNDLHRDLEIETVDEEIKKHAVMHGERIAQHMNVEVRNMVNTTDTLRRLKRKKPSDLMIIRSN